uniref:Uncharacterized protein n=1 Tax=Candidatus Kentrum eta TaxID=2126337 RepID=A0A450U9C7_9GAMM|nr:MAG: hypothetical protein BECKH772A_GA0070896_1001018 [Candidatus Kentron sp. H]VFJ90726.1 MAG: hypothetical protein BECKH772B_GA0070898_1001118 [Candidatus Kentron sp. H]VFJ96874.1 MAG: hypothetical protein BECKH772C_GA0070978_1000918 [Candidatus Kentron sp. H]
MSATDEDYTFTDYDAEGNITGIDIDNASTKVDPRKVILNKMPSQIEALAT